MKKTTLSKLPETLTSYKCRAEIATDAYRFALDNPLNIWYFKVQRFSKDIPDVVVSFKSELSIEAIKERMSKIEDTHVMIESLKLKDESNREIYLFFTSISVLILLLGGMLYVPYIVSKLYVFLYYIVLSIGLLWLGFLIWKNRNDNKIEF